MVDLADHDQNPRVIKGQEGFNGAKPEEISILYFKWAMRIKCAEEKMGNIFL